MGSLVLSPSPKAAVGVVGKAYTHVDIPNNVGDRRN